MTEIHPTAVIHDRASLGTNVTVGPYAVIEEDAVIGDNCQIDAFAQIKRMTSLGRNNRVHSYACVGGPPQDLKYDGEDTRLEIGDDNCIREYVTVNRGTVGGGGVTRIGTGCLLMAYVHIAHDCKLGDGVILANAATLAGHVEVDDLAVIGGLSAVHQFVRIGKHAYIGGMTGVSKDVPPFMLIAGERGWLHGLNAIGLKRQGFNSKQMTALKKAFKIIWRSGMSKQEALDKAWQDIEHTPEVLALIDFVRESERGVMTLKTSAD
jgi:UDP-N-acetylglucosamine acyltransferase